MATKADKERWDKLHVDLELATTAREEYESQLRGRYGWGDSSWRSWITKGERAKLERLDAREDKLGEKIYDLATKVSPRDWSFGAPSWWVRHKLTWEDAIRPTSEPLSVVPPLSYGSTTPKE